jgi:hypothetical protein
VQCAVLRPGRVQPITESTSHPLEHLFYKKGRPAFGFSQYAPAS